MKRFALSRGTRGTIGLVSLVVLGACAAQENDTTVDACANPKSVACSHTGGVSSTGGTSTGGSSNAAGSTAIGGTSSGSSGSSNTGGTSDPNAGAGTSSTVGGTASVGGTSATGGTMAIAGSGGTLAAGGTLGSGGGGSPGSGGGGSPGNGGGGAGGSVAVGGAGGAPNAACTTAIPARSSWTGTASSFSNVCTDPTYGLCNPPAYAFDTDMSSRFSTGKPQAGTEWLQIDFTTKGTVDQVVVSVSNGDFGRHLQIRMSDTSQDTAAPVLAEMDGVTGPMTFKFTPKTARFILVSQTKALATGETSWWSVQDVTATCN